MIIKRGELPSKPVNGRDNVNIMKHYRPRKKTLERLKGG